MPILKPILCVTGENPEFDPPDEPAIIRPLLVGLHKILTEPFQLSQLVLSQRARNNISKTYAKTVWDLVRMEPQYVVRIPKCGRKTRREIYDEVKRVWGIRLDNWIAD